MRMLFLLMAMLLAACVPAVSAHPGECLLSAHSEGTSLHMDCDNGKRACVVTMQGDLTHTYVGCGVADKAQCVAEVRHEGTKITLCLP